MDCLAEVPPAPWQSKAVVLPQSLAEAAEPHGKKRKGNVHASQDSLAENTTLRSLVNANGWEHRTACGCWVQWLFSVLGFAHPCVIKH